MKKRFLIMQVIPCLLLFLSTLTTTLAQVNLSNGLVGYYPLDNNQLDYSGNANHGTPSGGTGFTTDRLGNANSAASFGGTANAGKITIAPSTSLTFSTAVSFAFWARVNSATGTFGNGSQGAGGNQCLFAKGGDAGGGFWQLSSFASNTLTNQIGNNGSTTLTGALSPYALNQWFHYVVTMDASGHRIYVNGVLQSSNTDAANLAAMSTRNLVLGRFNSNWYALNGVLDEFRVYNRVITNDEIQALMQAPLATIDVNIVGATTFCAGSQVTVDYTSTGQFAAGNIFSLQLSDASGSFATPANVTQVTSSNNTGSITMTLPPILPSGTNYRYRIVSTAPNATSDTTNVITVNGVWGNIPNPALYTYVGTTNGNHYYVSTTTNTWAQSVINAQLNGGHLAVIPDVATQTLLQNAIPTNGAYFGYTDELVEGTWQWANGTFNGYTNWNTGEPNNAGGGVGEDYGHMTATGRWNDIGGSFLGNSFIQFAPAGINQTLCAGQAINLQASPLTGGTYAWSGPNGFASSLQNPTINNASGVASGTYTLTYTLNGCSATSSVDVAVNLAPSNLGQNTPLLTSLNNGRLLHYPMNGNATDASGNALNGTIVGGVTAMADRFGNANSALQFNGTNGYIDVPDGVYFNGTDFTVSAWVRKVSNNNWSRLFDFANGSANDNVLLTISHGTSGRPLSQIYTGTVAGLQVASPTVGLTNNKWELLSYTWSNGYGVLYIDGILRGQGVQSTPNNIIRTINYIGRSNWAGDAYANAGFDDFRIYNRKLNISEIQSLVMEQPNALTATVISGTICNGTTAQIALAHSQPGVTYQLRDAATATNVGTAQVGTGDTLFFTTGVLTTTTAFNFLASVNAGCNTILTPNITVTVQPIPTAPIASNDTICNSGIMTISVTGGNIYKWYATPTGGTALPTITGNTYTTPNINTTQNYYVSQIDAFGCESARTLVSAVVINPLNPPVDIINGLILHYKFDNNLTDYSGNGYNATVTGTNSYVNDRNGNALSAINSTAVADPGNNYISAGNPAKVQQLTNQVTVSMWIRQTQTWFGSSGTDGHMLLVNKWDGSTGMWVGLRMQNPSNMSNRVRWRVNGTTFLESNTNVPIETWHHVVCTYNGTQLRIYQNGVLTGTLNYTGTIANTGQNLLLGQQANGTPSYGITYRGDWDEVKIYNRSLNQSEIQTLFNNESVAFATSPLCDGEGDLALTTFNFPGATYSWTGPNGFTSTAQNPTVIVNADSATYAGTYSLQVAAQGCISPVQTVKAVIYEIPLSPTTTNDTICGSGNAILTASGAAFGASYQWYTLPTGGSPIVGQTSATLTINNVTATTNRYVSILRNGCEGPRTLVTAVYYSNVSTSLTVAGSSVCQGLSTTSITINNSEVGVSYQPYFGGNPAGNAVVGNGTTITLTTNTSGMSVGNNTVTIRAAQPSCGPVNLTNSATITVLAAPTVAITANGSLNFCSGDDVELTATTASSYLWSNGATTQSIIVNTTNSYNVTITDANGCNATSSTVNTVQTTTPSPVISAGGATTICNGNSVQLNASGGVSYLWSNGATTTSIAATQAGTYNFTAYNGACSAISTNIVVSVNSAPMVTASATQSTICAGEFVTLTGGGAQNYTWNNGVSNGVAFALSNTTTYQVTGTDANGCTNTAQITINVNNNPTVTANATNTSLCNGESVTLTGGGAQNYVWNNGVTNGAAFTPTTTATYQVTGTDANGCNNTAQITINVGTPPTVTANATNTTICAGEAVTLTGGGAQNYTWDNGATNGVAFTLSATTTYQVTGTDSNGCNNTAQITINVNALPNVTANATSTTLCAGESVTLTGGNAQNYTWDNSVSDGVSFTPSNTTTYQVTGTDSNGCNNTAQITINVNTLPNVTANATSTTLCAGESVTLTGGNAQNYTWDNSVSDGVSFTPSNTATYQVTGTDSNGCNNTATILITVNSLPTTSAINGDILVNCASTSELYNVLNTNGSTYTWTVPVGANILNGQGSNAIEIDFNSNFGIVEVQETDLNGCIGTPVQITIGCATGLELTQKDAINVYPIPAENYLNIELNDFAPNALLNLYDMQGKLISSQWIDNQSRIDISDLPGGGYIGRVIGDGGERSFRFLKRD